MLQTNSGGEEARLAALQTYAILDTPPEPEFDAFVRLAARLLEVPIAAVSFVDRDRAWFKAITGSDGTKEVNRDLAFCAYTLASPGSVLVVKDTRADPRFAENPFVTAPSGIRFYAGVPLIDPDGHALGALCALDRRPRRPDPADLALMADLAQGVVTRLHLRRQLERMRQTARQDPLTGLANRAAFEQALQSAIAEHKPIVLLLLDVEGFKAVNELHGHAVGDDLLREVARRLADAVGGADFVARLSGDDFAILLRGDALTPDPLSPLLHSLAGKLATPIAISGHFAPIIVTTGAARFPQDAADAKLLQRCADAALQRAKQAGGGSHALFDRARDRWVADQQSLERDLRHAVATGAFCLHWQPIVDLRASGEVVAVEALLRWERPGRGVIPPDQFIPLAERCGLIADIDSWVLRAACAAASGWACPQSTQPLRVAVNLSASWLRSMSIVSLVADTLAGSRLEPARLELEITEGALIADADAARAVMAALKALGVRLAIDDFGSGYSSLAYLATFPFDKVKLDRGFLKDIGRDGRAETILQAVVRLGRALGLTVCVEGVETAEQLTLLKAEELDQAQGYLLGRPSVSPPPASARKAGSVRQGGGIC